MSTKTTDTHGSRSDAAFRGRGSNASNASGEIQAWLDTVTRLLRVPPEERVAIREELESHVSDRVCDLMVTGLTEPEAVRRATEEFGDASALAQSFRTARQGFFRRHLMHTALLTVASSALGLSVLAVSDVDLFGRSLPDRAEVYAPSVVGDAKGEAKKAVAIKAGEATLDSVLTDVIDSTGDQPLIRWQALEDIGVDEDDVMMVPPGQLTIDAIFAEINDQIVDGDLGVLDYRIADGVIEVSTQDEFDKRETILVKYDVSDILQKSMVPQATAMNRGGAGRTAAGYGGDTQARREILEQVVDNLQAHVSRDDWQDQGGDKISVTTFGEALYITGPARVHPQIAWLLDKMADHAAENAAEEASESDPTTGANTDPVPQPVLTQTTPVNIAELVDEYQAISDQYLEATAEKGRVSIQLLTLDRDLSFPFEQKVHEEQAREQGYARVRELRAKLIKLNTESDALLSRMLEIQRLQRESEAKGARSERGLDPTSKGFWDC